MNIAYYENFVVLVKIGLNNLASCVTSNGLSYLYDGKPLKSINHYYNKQKANYQSIAMKQGLKYTNRLVYMDIKRNHRIKDFMRKEEVIQFS